MKSIKFIVSILCMLALISCAHPTDTMPTGAHAIPPAPISHDGIALRIVTPSFESEDSMRPRVDYLKTLLEPADIEIDFEIIPINASNVLKEHAAYMTLVEERIEDGADEVFIIPLDHSENLLNQGILRDLYADGMRVAPEYTAAYATVLNEEETLYLAPINASSGIPNRYAALMRRDAYDRYGKEIHTAGNLRDALEWLKADDTGSVPGACFPGLGAILSDYSLALELYLPEQGYFPAWRSDVFYGEQQREVYAAYDLPESRDAYVWLLSLVEEDLLDMQNFSRLKKPKYTLADSSLLLFPLSDICTGFGAWQGTPLYTAFNELDFNGYHMSILYPDTLPDFGTGNPYTAYLYCAVAGAGADATEFLKLMEWLCDPGNYRTFHYGAEGVDYTLDDRGLVMPLVTRLNYSEWNYLFYYRRGSGMTMSNFPAEYTEAIDEIKPSYWVPIGLQEKSALRAWLYDPSRYDSLIALNNDYDALFKNLYDIREDRNRREILDNWLANIQKADPARDAVNRFREALPPPANQ